MAGADVQCRAGGETPQWLSAPAPLITVALVLVACAHQADIAVGNVDPVDCALLGKVGGGAAYEVGMQERAVQQLKKETAALGGNYLACCFNDGAVVLYAYLTNSASGQTAGRALEGYQYYGRAYRCEGGDVH